MIEKIILKKSSVLDKMPTAEQLDYGEIALNYNAEHPFISFKDSDGDVMPLNDYSQDIAYLYSHKLDAGVLDTINENSDAIKKKLNITDFNTFKADNTKTINAFATEVAKALETKVDKTDIEQTTGQSTTSVMSQKAVSDALSTKVGKTDIVQSTGTSETAVMSQKAVSDALSNVYTKAESDARYLRGEFEYCGLMEWDGKNEVKIYEMQFDSPKREVFIFAQCTYDKTNKGDFKIIITNETQPSDNYGISYYNSASNAEECFHIHNVCGNYVCDINSSNNHLVPNALKRCYMRDLLTDQNHEDVGLITNLKIEITKDLVRIDGVQKWYVFAKK